MINLKMILKLLEGEKAVKRMSLLIRLMHMVKKRKMLMIIKEKKE